MEKPEQGKLSFITNNKDEECADVAGSHPDHRLTGWM